ncbi:MAG TPA: nucleotidyltransferase domain-containing protein [Nitrososphaerales archaeon]|nr:nucleotidyltransferase domain-containing protein [Nitrososphaerales archaeon]
MWPQRWLGRGYSTLYSSFGRGVFTFAQACSVTGMGENKLAVAFSKLHSAGILIIFKRSRPRQYRLLDPRSFLLRSSGEVSRSGPEQEEYTQLVHDVYGAVRERVKLTSFCVYGSVAKGSANPLSDLDIVLVSDDFRGSLASRLDSLGFVEKQVGGELAFLASHGYTTSVSLFPLRREEAERAPILFLDLTLDAKVVHDEGGFLEGILSKLGARLDLVGAKRVNVDGGWYWDLKPGLRFGELIEV